MEEKHVESFTNSIIKLSKKIKGVSVIITDRNKTVFEYYHGDVDGKGTKNDNKKMMMIASNTKLLTMIAIMQFIEQGKLRLEDDIQTHLPKLNIPSRFTYDAITIKQLLMHRSGILGDDLSLSYDSTKTMKDIIPVLNKSYMVSVPGTMYAYCNLGYGLLGLLIEKLSNTTYADYIYENVTKPLEMNLKIIPTKEGREKYKNVISQSFNKKGKVVIDPLSANLACGSSTYATADDLAKLLRLFMNPGKQSVLKQETLEKVLTMIDAPFYEDKEARHGFGLMFNYKNYESEAIGEIVGHGGDTVYHHSSFQFAPKLGIGIAVMTNSEKGRIPALNITNKLFADYIKLLGIEISMPDKTSPQVEIDLKKYENTFVAIGLLSAFKYTKRNRLVAKIGFLKFYMTLREDGFFDLHPIGISKLKMFSKKLKVLKIRIKKLQGETVVYSKTYYNFYSTVVPSAVLYKKQKDVSRYEYLVGKYELVEATKHCIEMVTKISFKIKSNKLLLVFKWDGIKATYYLDGIDDNTLIIQGIGRGTRETLIVTKDNNEIILMYKGTQFKKVS